METMGKSHFKQGARVSRSIRFIMVKKWATGHARLIVKTP